MPTLPPGVYLNTMDEMIQSQTTWGDPDLSKDVDFTQHKFWVTTDDGQDPEGFDSVKEALTFIKGE